MKKNNHKWSGWPGAYCMKCGVEDSLENAIGLGWYDPYSEKWDTEEHMAELEKIFEKGCPVSDIEWAIHLREQGQLHLWKDLEQKLFIHENPDKIIKLKLVNDKVEIAKRENDKI